jgi:hypothetical protein
MSEKHGYRNCLAGAVCSAEEKYEKEISTVAKMVYKPASCSGSPGFRCWPGNRLF